MSKQLIIFVWPQLDGDSDGQASFVVRDGHSLPCSTLDGTEARYAAAPASIMLI
jgi:hypothetical protein